MSALARFWLLASDAAEHEGVLDTLRRAGACALYASPRTLSRAARCLDLVRGATEPLAVEEFGDAALRQLADRHGGESVLLVVEPELALDIVRRALAAPHDRREHLSIDVRHFCAVDWPPSSDPDGRPALIGIDLDWIPPPPPRKRAKFPGGPGSAPSARG